MAGLFHAANSAERALIHNAHASPGRARKLAPRGYNDDDSVYKVDRPSEAP